MDFWLWLMNPSLIMQQRKQSIKCHWFNDSWYSAVNVIYIESRAHKTKQNHLQLLCLKLDYVVKSHNAFRHHSVTHWTGLCCKISRCFPTSLCATLCHATSFCAMLSHATSFYAALSHAISLCTMLSCAKSLCTTLSRAKSLLPHSGYRSRGPGFDSRRFQIFWEAVGLERGPLSLVSTREYNW
jgi:hypothetical protein